MACFIQDGYTRDASFPKTKYHDGMKISYRPMLRTERLRLAQKGATAPVRGDKAVTEASQEVCKSLANHLKSWGPIDGDDSFPAITAETVGQLEPNLFEKVYNAVGGFDDEEQSAGN